MSWLECDAHGLTREAACPACCDEAEAHVKELEAALEKVHDLSLLPFDDNKRREIGSVARAAIANDINLKEGL